MRNHLDFKKIRIFSFSILIFMELTIFLLFPLSIKINTHENSSFSQNYAFILSSNQENSDDPSIEDLENYYNNQILHFYGDGVMESFNISKTALLNNTYETCKNLNFTWLNKMGTKNYLQISGVFLYSIFNNLDVLNDNATYIRFVGNDGYKSYYFPIRIMKNNTHSVIITTEENGEVPPKGPIESNVLYESIVNDSEMIAMFKELGASGENFVYNSLFNVHYLSAIEISTIHLNYNNTIENDDNPSINDIKETKNQLSILGYSEWIEIFSFTFIIMLVTIVNKKKNRKQPRN